MSFSISALVALGLAVIVGPASLVISNVDDNTHDGKVVSSSSSKLVMTSNDGKQHTHTLAIGAKVTCDGVTCKLEKLKAGMTVRVTTKNATTAAATRIEALDKNDHFERRDK